MTAERLAGNFAMHTPGPGRTWHITDDYIVGLCGDLFPKGRTEYTTTDQMPEFKVCAECGRIADYRAGLQSDPAGSGPMQLPVGQDQTDGGPERRNALALEPAIFALEVRLPGDLPIEVLDLIAGIAEAQAELFTSAAAEELTACGYGEVADRLEPLVFDPQHPSDAECYCVGAPGWHCPGEDSQHWAKFLDDPKSECGHCGGSPES